MILPDRNTKSIMEYGDYQTPANFAKAVCGKLAHFYKLPVDVILEPTFGTGNFIHEALIAFPGAHSLYGIEINKDYYNAALRLANTTKVKLFNSDVFNFDFGDIKKNISAEESLLIIGNPPWVTSAQLSSLRSANIPAKSNFKKHAGLAAMTGKGNFDIAENIILKLLNDFSDYNCTLAMLCKTIVAKNIIQEIRKYAFPMASMDLFIFNANEIFGVNCDAGLLVVRLGYPKTKTCSVYDFYTSEKQKEFGWCDDAFYSDTQYYGLHANIDGKCQYEWRQGVKHDCSKVMELQTIDSMLFQNGLGEVLKFQPGRYVFPLVKSSDLKSYSIIQTHKFVIVPQRRVHDDTAQIQFQDPDIWEYLQRHEHHFAARRSAIYKSAPKYSIFGIGDYSFAKYKVGVSGFYKEPFFALIWGEYPMMMDDTCYFLAFEKFCDALITLSLLNSSECLDFLKSIAFLDSKRPYTKEILQRIDLEKLADCVGFAHIHNFIRSTFPDAVLSPADFENYRSALSSRQPDLFSRSYNLIART
ncbi:MAG: methyltransferase [Spirochaetota bacterium]|jgi:16S rRNA A1518/A1519 N6-dimethyltransferase RsmA/KsgA/DIM1 with predicted DNA glycosylase/AP lyase activity|nr:methyltransferase [Spirochaetota bacterium]